MPCNFSFLVTIFGHDKYSFLQTLLPVEEKTFENNEKTH